MPATNEQIIRLYDTIFDRAPDADGLAFWNRVADAGYGLDYMAAQFIVAPEFATTYGQPTNAAFVQEMYANVLDRPGEAGGVAFWTRVLDEGLAGRPAIVLEFSESPEHIAQMATAAGPAPAPQGRFVAASGDGPQALDGGAGNDTILGGAGDDAVRGLDGNDVIEGRQGQDALYGGPGADLFVFRKGDGFDRIADYEPGDRILFIDLDAGDVGIVAAHGPPAGPGQMSSFAGYDVVYGQVPGQGHFRFDGIAYDDLAWVKDSYQFQLG